MPPVGRAKKEALSAPKKSRFNGRFDSQRCAHVPLVQRDVDGALEGVARVIVGADAIPGGGAAHVGATAGHHVEAALEPAPEVAGSDDEAVDDGDVRVVEVPHALDGGE